MQLYKSHTNEAIVDMKASPSAVLDFLHSATPFIYARFGNVPQGGQPELAEQGIYNLEVIIAGWPTTWKLVVQNSPEGITIDGSTRLFRYKLHEEWTVQNEGTATANDKSPKTNVKVISTVKVPPFMQGAFTKWFQQRMEKVKRYFK
ncbi:unnamed protein product [Sympodiomycopsis kandeliae]